MMRGEFDNDGTVNVRRRAELAIRSQLQLASAKFEPVEHFLDRMSKKLAREYGPSTALQRRGGMQPTALNTFEVRYSIPYPEEAPLSLTFIVTGENADTILIQGRQGSAAGEVSADPGQLDQRVYRLERLGELKQALRERIIGHLTSQFPNRAGPVS
jgi:hypothetical protein